MEITQRLLLELKEENLENVQYNIQDFPVYVRRGRLSAYPGYSANVHWHDDIELIAVLSGHMLYNINGTILPLEAGDGVFVNSRQLHFGFSKNRSDCDFICVLLHPFRLCHSRYLEQSYLFPVIHNDRFTYCHLHRGNDWQQEILDGVLQIYRLQDSPTFPLLSQSIFYHLWARLYEHCQDGTTPAQSAKEPGTFDKAAVPSRQAQNLAILKDMLQFIQGNFSQKLTLEDIAASGGVCKSTCCALFRQYLKQSPLSYVTVCRLNKSVELMDTTDLTFSEISGRVGFSGSSYYSETFRRVFGLSPSEYRKKA